MKNKLESYFRRKWYDLEQACFSFLQLKKKKKKYLSPKSRIIYNTLHNF